VTRHVLLTLGGYALGIAILAGLQRVVRPAAEELAAVQA
jgi:hypothetical protein